MIGIRIGHEFLLNRGAQTNLSFVADENLIRAQSAILAFNFLLQLIKGQKGGLANLFQRLVVNAAVQLDEFFKSRALIEFLKLGDVAFGDVPEVIGQRQEKIFVSDAHAEREPASKIVYCIIMINFMFSKHVEVQINGVKDFLLLILDSLDGDQFIQLYL